MTDIADPKEAERDGFGFTQEDVERLRALADDGDALTSILYPLRPAVVKFAEGWDEQAKALRRLADRIEALLLAEKDGERLDSMPNRYAKYLLLQPSALA